MARKWYVVTVGKEIGVFATWIEVAPFVKGYPEAVYQSFQSEEEAKEIFREQEARGNTRIIQDHRTPISRTATELTSAMFSSVKPTVHSEWYSQSASCQEIVPSAQLRSRPITIHSGSGNDVYDRTRHTSITPHRKSKSKYDEKRNGDSSPKLSPSGVRKSISAPNDQITRAIVQTPSWINAYPTKPDDISPLSPLSRKDIPLGAALGSPGHSYPKASKIPQNQKDDRFFDLLSSKHPDQRSSSPRKYSENPVFLSGELIRAKDSSDCFVPSQPPKYLFAIRNVSEQPLSHKPIHSQSLPLPKDLIASPIFTPHDVYAPKEDPRSPVTRRNYFPFTTGSLSFGRPSPNIRNVYLSEFSLASDVRVARARFESS